MRMFFFFFLSQLPAERVEDEGEGEHLPTRRPAFSSSSQWRGERRRAAGSFTSTDAEIHSCAAAAVMDHSRDLLFLFFFLSVNDPHIAATLPGGLLVFEVELSAPVGGEESP